MTKEPTIQETLAAIRAILTSLPDDTQGLPTTRAQEHTEAHKARAALYKAGALVSQ